MIDSWWDSHEWDFLMRAMIAVMLILAWVAWKIGVRLRAAYRERLRLRYEAMEEEDEFDESNRIVTRGPSGYLFCSPRDSRNCVGCPGPPSDGQCGMDMVLEGKAEWRKGKPEVRSGLEEA